MESKIGTLMEHYISIDINFLHDHEGKPYETNKDETLDSTTACMFMNGPNNVRCSSLFLFQGTYLVTQAAAREMVSSNVPNGAIVNISSIVGKTGNMGQCNYAASKAGVVGFTKTVALELAKHNIRCNAIMPGFIDTPMVATVPEKVMLKLKGRIPMGRFGKPEELADAVLFLCSPASSYVTGSVLEVTGGLYM